MAEVPVMPRRYTLSTLGVAYHCRCRTAQGAFAAFLGAGGRILPFFGLPQQACRYSDREDRCCGCFVLQKTVHRLIYGSASTSVREVRISSISSPVTGGRVRPTCVPAADTKAGAGPTQRTGDGGGAPSGSGAAGNRQCQDLLAAAGWRYPPHRQRGAAARTSGAAGRLAGSGGWSLPVPSAGGGGQPPGNEIPGLPSSGQRQGAKQ
mgnify:CR=1 FL=1